MVTKGENLPSVVAELQRRTAELIVAAGALDDSFLQYLYGLALSHLRELAGSGNTTASAPQQDQ